MRSAELVIQRMAPMILLRTYRDREGSIIGSWSTPADRMPTFQEFAAGMPKYMRAELRKTFAGLKKEAKAALEAHPNSRTD